MKGKKKIIVVFVALVFFLSIPKLFVLGNSRPSAKDIKDGTLIIGTHLIDLNGLNEEIANIAEKSAEKNNQNRVYYKSDLNKGVWYDISNAETVGDISTSTANVVANSEIDKLVLTHYTREDGSTIEFESNSIVSPHEIYGLENPYNMQEAEELIKERDLQKELANNSKDEEKDLHDEKVNSIDRVLEKVKDDEIDKINGSLDMFEEFIFNLNEKGSKPEEIDIVVEKKLQKIAERNLKSYEVVMDRINNEMKSLKYENHKDLIEKLSKMYTNIQTKIGELQSSLPYEGEGILATIKMDYELELDDALEKSNFDKAEKALSKVISCIDIMESKIKNKTLELETLYLAIDKGKELLDLYIVECESSQCKYKENEQESNSVLKSIKAELSSKIKDLIEEYIKIIGYIYERTESKDEKITLLEELNEHLNTLKNETVDCGMEDAIKTVIQENLDDIQKDLVDIKTENSSEYQKQKEKLNSLMKDVNDLNELYIGALEERDNKSAEKFKEEIDKKLSEIDKIESENINEYNELLEEKEKLNKDLESAENESKTEIQSKIDELDVKINALEGLINDKDKKLLEMKDEYVGEIEEALKVGDIEKLKEDYDKLTDLMKTIDGSLLSDKNKVSLLDYISDELAEKQIQLINSGDSSKARKLEDFKKYISQDKELIQSGLFDEITDEGKQDLEMKDEYIDEIEEALKVGDIEKLEKEYKNLINLMGIIDDSLFNDESKLSLLDDISDLMSDKQIQLTNSGDSAKARKLEELKKELLQDKALIESGMLEDEKDDDSDLDDENSGGIGDLGVDFEEDLEKYKKYSLAIPEYNTFVSYQLKKQGEAILIPIEQICSKMGSEILYSSNSTTERVIIKDEGVLIELTIGSKEAYINDRRVKLDTEVYYDESIIYAPIECIIQGYNLSETTNEKTIILYKEGGI